MNSSGLLLGALLNIAELITAPATTQNLQNEIVCMAEVIYHEARGEPQEGKAAVAAVVLNRVKTPVKYWKDTVCEVVYQPGQFVWTTTFPQGHSHRHHEQDAWNRAIIKATVFFIADQAGIEFAPQGVESSTFFSVDGFRNPKITYDATIGGHQFFSLVN